MFTIPSRTCATTQQTFLRLSLPDGAPAATLEACWPSDEAPDVDDKMTPERAVSLIERRIESYVFYSGRAEKRAVIAWSEANMGRLTRLWAEELVRRKTAAVKQLQGEIDELTAEYLDEESDD